MEDRSSNFDNFKNQTPSKSIYQSYLTNTDSKSKNNLLKRDITLPKSPTYSNTYKDFLKILKAYYKELKRYDINSCFLSKDDIFVINDLLTESFSYINNLIQIKYFAEVKPMIKYCEKIIDCLIKKFNYSNNGKETKKITYLFALKLQILEIKFDMVFNIEGLYEESEKIILEILSLQNILNMPTFNVACSYFYYALVKFCKFIF